jgi:hypothetical protein
MKSTTTVLASLRFWLLAIVIGLLAIGTIGFVVYVRRVLEPNLVQSAATVLTNGSHAPADSASIAAQLQAGISAQTDRLVWLHFIAMAAIFAGVTVTLIVLLRQRLTRPLGGELDTLTDASDRIGTYASQVSADAGALANVTSKAAAGIEEIASTVEELASMTQRNADHASETDRLMQQTRATVTEADASMRSLLAAIQSIQRQSAATSKIIETIDEIAFQTNILALNAAIEAARAGEHGASFAVVADEVRTLARHAAESARDTGVLLEQTNREVMQAATMVDDTSKRFEDVNGRVLKSSGFVSQIAQASTEQARGLDQLNTAIGKIENVVQQTVANAEHSAAAAEKMTEESQAIDGTLGNLRSLLGSQRRAASVAASDEQGEGPRVVLKVAVSSIVGDSLAKWTRDRPVFQIERFDSPHANRPTVDLVLQLQALAAGGLDFDYELSIHTNYGRALVEVTQGYADLTAESIWDSEIAAEPEALIGTTPVIRNGEFEKGIYTLPNNTRLLNARLPDQWGEFIGVTVFNWTLDVQLLENLGIKRIEKVSKIENAFPLIRDGRADFTLLEFAPTADMSIERGGISLVPVPQCKITLPGSRSWIIARQSQHAEAIHAAFERGIGVMRREGRFERAYRECGFINPKVAGWRRVSESMQFRAGGVEESPTDEAPLRF